MYARVHSAGVIGVDGFLVEVECDTGPGLNSFEVVGLPETAVRESRVRIRSAIDNSGFVFPTRRITINMAPADVPKRGTLYDLPQAVALLAADARVPIQELEGSLIVGELSLTGETRPIPGVLPMTILARQRGFSRVFLPSANAAEAAVVEGIQVLPVDTLDDLVGHVTGRQLITKTTPTPNHAEYSSIIDMADVKGQEWTKEALVIAAAGGHNLLMTGSPGSGKTMLARRLPTILPAMSQQESLETTKIYSVAGLLRGNQGLVTQRPFRAPHHTVSHVALVGGGSIPRPGEVSLAHNGILFLDELPEFPRAVLECLRQPLEDRTVTVSRAAMSCTFPASFTLVASMNPCPCGHRGDERKRCTCDDLAVRRYMARLSGPLLDRIDMHVQVRGVAFERLQERKVGATSEELRGRVLAAREVQLARFQGEACGQNAAMSAKLVARHCGMDASSRLMLQQAFEKRGMSARSYERVLKVARTIADLQGVEKLSQEHLAQALRYRELDLYVS